MRERCVIVGGGGHARVLIDCLQTGKAASIAGIVDRDRSLWGTDVLGVRVLGGDDAIAGAAKSFVVGLGATADNGPRRRLFELCVSLGLKPLTVRHPTAWCSPRARVGEGSALMPLCVVNAGAVLGVNVIVNSAAVVEHDCRVGDHAHVATGAVLAGGVVVGAGAHIGAGAVVRQGLTIGEGAVVGAGAVVVKDVPPRAVVAGVPARPLKKRRS